MKQPRITVVTPSYQQASFLDLTMQSVLNQDYGNLEYIVIDGGSTDGSVDIINSCADQLSYWVSEKDQGQSHAINKGFARATGEIYCWINSDDLLEPGSLNCVASYFSRNPDCQFLNGGCRTIDESGGPSPCPDENGVLHTERHLELLPEDAFVHWTKRWFAQQSTFWSAGLWKRCGGLDESLHFAMDYDLWQRFSRHAELRVVREVLASYRFHSDAKCSVQLDALLIEILDVQARHSTAEVQTFWKQCRQAMELQQSSVSAQKTNTISRSLWDRILSLLKRRLTTISEISKT